MFKSVGHNPGYLNCSIKGHLYCPDANSCAHYMRKKG